MKKALFLLPALMLMGAGCLPSSVAPTPVTPNPTTATPAAGPGEHCGGNMRGAAACEDGYHCAPEPGSTLPFGDVGGTCVADEEAKGGPAPGGAMCTMEAKQCPDGSYVGRQPPNCEFAPCPGEPEPSPAPAPAPSGY